MKIPQCLALTGLLITAGCDGSSPASPDSGASFDAGPLPDARPDAPPVDPDAAPDAARDLLIVDVDGAGEVQIEVAGAVTTCSAAACSVDVTGASSIVLTAKAGAEATFQGFRGCSMGDDDRCHLAGDERHVVAAFAHLAVPVARVFASDRRDFPLALATDAAGNAVFAWTTIVTATTEGSYHLVKVAPDGQLLWQRSWADSDAIAAHGGIAVAPDGQVYVVGRARTTTGGGPVHVETQVFGLDGATGADERAIPVLSGANLVAVATNGDLLVCGQGTSTNSHEIARYAFDTGGERWSGGAGPGLCDSFAALPDGNAAVLSYQPTGIVPSPVETGAFTYRGSDGVELWHHQLGFDHHLTEVYGVTGDGSHVFAAGVTASVNYVLSLSAGGGELWRFAPGDFVFAQSPVIAGDAVAVALNLWNGGSFGSDVLGGHDDGGLLLLDRATGEPELARRLGGAGAQSARLVANGPDGSFWIAGQLSQATTFGATTLTPVGGGDAFLVRVTP